VFGFLYHMASVSNLLIFKRTFSQRRVEEAYRWNVIALIVGNVFGSVLIFSLVVSKVIN